MQLRLTTAILVATAAIAPSAASAKTGSVYDVTLAKGFERITFSGDSNAACSQYGTCGYDGTVTYRIGGKPHGTLKLTRGRNGRAHGLARYKTGGVTRSRVTPPDGGADCTDTVRHKTDIFGMESIGTKHQTLALGYHPIGPDYLDTLCGGPNEGAASDAGVLPRGTFRAADFFKGNRPRFSLTGGTPFRAGGFSSVIEWNLSFKLKARACSPHCKFR
ncbi:MAG: hypothetical protein QOH76_1096 [Thermoleophilaceae bacterium]|jgi:hypothetical protein|nr:hypothetical protein [Thermoleophilaceae bacterium]